MLLLSFARESPMPDKKRDLSEYRAMWLFAMFDLPVDTREARKRYVRFRKALLREGFMMLQFSVYARYFASEEGSESHRKRIRAIIPSEGQVRLMAVTDKQFGKMEVFYGKTAQEPEKAPEQLMLF
jgi:CRISPR-associated protein Cas2